MKKLPQRIWLDEESCWNNEPQYSKGYVEYVREDYHAQAMLHVLHKGVKQGRREMLDEVCKWIERNGNYYIGFTQGQPCITDDFIENLKKWMKE